MQTMPGALPEPYPTYTPAQREWVEMYDDRSGRWVPRQYRGILLDGIGGRLDEFPYMDITGNCWRKMRRIAGDIVQC